MANSGSNQPSGYFYHHLSFLSLVLLCSLGGFLAGCGVWYLFRRLVLTPTRVPAKYQVDVVSPRGITIHNSKDNDDEEQHIEIPPFSKPAHSKKRSYYGDITTTTTTALSEDHPSSAKPYGMQSWFKHLHLIAGRGQNQNQARRRSSSSNSSKDAHSDVEDRTVDTTRLADSSSSSPCARLSSKAAVVSRVPPAATKEHKWHIDHNCSSNIGIGGGSSRSDSRPNRLWGPREDVKSREMRARSQQRTVSRTISFWKRTSALAKKYSDDHDLHSSNGRPHHHHNSHNRYNDGQSTVDVFQSGSGTTPTRIGPRPLPHPPTLNSPSPFNNSNYSNTKRHSIPLNTTRRTSESAFSHHSRSVSVPTTSSSSSPYPQHRTTRNQTQSTRTTPRHASSLHSSIHSHSSTTDASSISIPRTPRSEVSHLGMDELRAAVDGDDDYNDDESAEWLSLYSSRRRPVDKMNWNWDDNKDKGALIPIPVPAAAGVVPPSPRYDDVGNVGDPYLRIQKIVEHAYHRTLLPSPSPSRSKQQL